MLVDSDTLFTDLYSAKNLENESEALYTSLRPIYLLTYLIYTSIVGE